jgi:LacI family transcriptional regulator
LGQGLYEWVRDLEEAKGVSVSDHSRPVGIREVAKAAGVSLATASFALNGRDGVAAETRRRILAVADELGYRANPQAQALRRGRSNTYGLVVRNLANPFFLDIMSGAEQVASDVGATLLFLDSQYSVARERQHVQSMAGQLVAGLAIAPVGTGESIRLWQSLRPGSPAVALNAAVDGLSDVSRVMPDNQLAIELPMTRLAELGHTNIAFLSAPRPLMADPDRLRNFRRLSRALSLHGRVCYAALNMAAVQAAIKSLLSEADRSTAIIANSDHSAQAIYKAARQLGVGIGAEFSVVGHDDLPTSELLDPPLSTIWLDRREMGRQIMYRLLGVVPTSDYLAPVRYVERASVHQVVANPSSQ